MRSLLDDMSWLLRHHHRLLLQILRFVSRIHLSLWWLLAVACVTAFRMVLVVRHILTRASGPHPDGFIWTFLLSSGL